MIVYGDPEYRIKLRAALCHLVGLAETPPSLQNSRDLLIGLGQVEQGLDDSHPNPRLNPLTDLAAADFLRALDGKSECSRKTIQSALQDLASDAAGEITIKIPEGFAFYCLFPEQYAAATEEWIKKAVPGQVLVIGLRSIGTTLSAVVKATLQARGFDARRITLRPSGHPFQRQVSLPSVLARQVLIVDEGPGLSGSSMASVAEAAAASGISSVTFLPSHSGGPGSAASESVLQIWNNTPTIVFPFSRELGHGHAIWNDLRKRSENIIGGRELEFRDLSAGAWRAQHGVEVFAVPAFERTKWLFLNGGGRGVLWKFAGLGPGGQMELLAVNAMQRQQALAERNWTVPVLDQAHGFIGMEWISGEVLSQRSLDDGFIARLAAHIRATRTNIQPASRDFERLRHMTCFNIEAGLGPSFAQPAEELFNQPVIGEFSHGDGRMAPHEWVSRGEHLFKMDVWGHERDHTCIGPQSFLWDVAGSMVEWQMIATAREKFMASLQVNPAHLRPYVVAYCAFKLGLLSFAAGTNSGERRHLLALVRRIFESSAVGNALWKD